MDAVGNTDRLVRLLRQQLERRAKATRGRQAPLSNVEDTDTTRQTLARAVRQKGAARDRLRRELIRHLLANSFGPEIVGLSRFGAIADEVASRMCAAPELAAALDTALEEIAGVA